MLPSGRPSEASHATNVILVKPWKFKFGTNLILLEVIARSNLAVLMVVSLGIDNQTLSPLATLYSHCPLVESTLTMATPLSCMTSSSSIMLYANRLTLIP